MLISRAKCARVFHASGLTLAIQARILPARSIIIVYMAVAMQSGFSQSGGTGERIARRTDNYKQKIYYSHRGGLCVVYNVRACMYVEIRFIL